VIDITVVFHFFIKTKSFSIEKEIVFYNMADLKAELELYRAPLPCEETFGKPGSPLISPFAKILVFFIVIYLPYRGARLAVKRVAQAVGVEKSLGFVKKPKTG
jgi:hypothetical protein